MTGGEPQPSEVLRQPHPTIQPEINTDISQFLNTKHTFDHNLTDATHTADGGIRNREFLEKEPTKV